MNEQTYATERDIIHTQTYPIKLIGGKFVNAENTLDESALWRLQQVLFELKMALIHKMLEEEVSPVGDVSLELEIRATRRVVSDEATNGDPLRWSEDNHYVTVSKLVRPF